MNNYQSIFIVPVFLFVLFVILFLFRKLIRKGKMDNIQESYIAELQTTSDPSKTLLDIDSEAIVVSFQTTEPRQDPIVKVPSLIISNEDTPNQETLENKSHKVEQEAAIKVREEAQKNGLKTLHIEIPAFNHSSVNNAEILELKPTKHINHTSDFLIDVKEISFSGIPKKKFYFVTINDGKITMMDAKEQFVCEDFFYKKPLSGTNNESVILTTLINNALVFYDQDLHFITEINDIVRRLRGFSQEENNTVKICNMAKAYERFNGRKKDPYTYIIGVLKNEKLIPYVKQIETSRKYCSWLMILKSFLDTNRQTVDIVGEDISFRLTKAYSNIINELPENAILNTDWDRIDYKETVIGTIKMEDMKFIGERPLVLCLKRDKETHKLFIAAIKLTNMNIAYFVDLKNEQYFPVGVKEKLLKVKSAFMGGFPLGTKSVSFNCVGDYLSASVQVADQIHLESCNIKDYLHNNKFRFVLLDNEGNSIFSSTSCSKPLLKALWLSMNKKHQFSVLRCDLESKKLRIQARFT